MDRHMMNSQNTNKDQGDLTTIILMNALKKNGVFRAYYKSQNLCYNIADKSQGTVVNPEGVFLFDF